MANTVSYIEREDLKQQALEMLDKGDLNGLLLLARTDFDRSLKAAEALRKSKKHPDFEEYAGHWIHSIKDSRSHLCEKKYSKFLNILEKKYPEPKKSRLKAGNTFWFQ